MEEIWKELHNYPGYEVSNLGQVRRTRTGKILKQKPTLSDTMTVPLSVHGELKCRSVHILVASEFVDNPHDFVYVHHLDGNKKNNHADNLEWYARPQCKLLKKVYQYDVDWSFIREFTDARMASEVEDIPVHRIFNCCHMTSEIAGGFRWSYYPPEERKAKMDEYFEGQMNQDILQYDRLDNFIRAWGSITEASEELHITPWKILRCCQGLTRYAGGYGWEFAERFL